MIKNNSIFELSKLNIMITKKQVRQRIIYLIVNLLLLLTITILILIDLEFKSLMVLLLLYIIDFYHLHDYVYKFINKYHNQYIDY